MDSNRFPWIQTDLHGSKQIPMDANRFAWIQMNSCGFKQIPMDSNGFSWIQTNLHGFKRISDVDSNSYTQTPAFHLKLFVKNKENNTKELSVGMANAIHMPQRQHAPTCG